jgi:hypothetical protein
LQGRYLQTAQHKHRINAHRVGFDPTIPVFERAKAAHALDLRGHCASNEKAKGKSTLYLIKHHVMQT